MALCSRAFRRRTRSRSSARRKVTWRTRYASPNGSNLKTNISALLLRYTLAAPAVDSAADFYERNIPKMKELMLLLVISSAAFAQQPGGGAGAAGGRGGPQGPPLMMMIPDLKDGGALPVKFSCSNAPAGVSPHITLT